MRLSLRIWQQNAPVLSTFASVMGICSMGLHVMGLHVTMIKNLSTKVLFFQLTTFNASWEHHVWPWTQSQVVFIRKAKKRNDETKYHSIALPTLHTAAHAQKCLMFTLVNSSAEH